jgi:hypothetical protein
VMNLHHLLPLPIKRYSYYVRKYCYSTRAIKHYYQIETINLHVFESSARPKLELDESKAAAFLANVFSLLQWSLPFFFWKKRTYKQNLIFMIRHHNLYTIPMCQ